MLQTDCLIQRKSHRISKSNQSAAFWEAYLLGVVTHMWPIVRSKPNTDAQFWVNHLLAFLLLFFG